MSQTIREVVHEGWLIKSPPTKRIWRARWRRRWFTLRHSGELPGQFFLEYYTDRNCRKLKGTIDLDQCEQVDAGLLFEQRKLKYPYMFDVKTPNRIYYLAAESEEDMNNWVDCICQVCGLKAFTDEQELQMPVSDLPKNNEHENRLVDDTNTVVPETPPLSPISGPYIPISECITGRPLPSNQQVQDFYSLLNMNMNATNIALNNTQESAGGGGGGGDIDLVVCSIPPTPQKRKHQQQNSISSTDLQNPEDPRFYDMPRQLQPAPSSDKSSNPQKWIDSNLNSSLEQRGGSTPPLQSPTDSESVFTTDDEWTHPTPTENGLKEPRPSDSSLEMEPSSWSVVQRFGKLQVVDSPSFKSNETPTASSVVSIVGAPPRPPKPSHLGKGGPGPCYLNLGSNSPTASRLKIGAREQVDLVGQTTAPSNPDNDNKDKDNKEAQPITDEMYDFPRSHNVSDGETSKQILSNRHCYNNAAPSNVEEGQVFRYDITATEAMTMTMTAAASSDQIQFDGCSQDEEPASPCSQSSSSTTAMYSNLPSPLLADFQSGPGGGPPIVNRCLKPGRKLSDSASICSLPEPSSPRSAPNVDRKLKPSSSVQVRKPNELEIEHGGSLRLPRAAPSPTPPNFSSSRDDIFDDEQVYFYEHRQHQFLAAPPRSSKEFEKLQYIDLDLESADATTLNGGGGGGGGSLNSSSSCQPPKSPGQPTVYKTVDFVKTEAFKRTRQCVEEARQKCSVEP